MKRSLVFGWLFISVLALTLMSTTAVQALNLTLTSSDPGNGSTTSHQNDAIVMIFGQTVGTPTATSANVYISADGTTTVTSAGIYFDSINALNDTIVLYPDEDLGSSTVYVVTLIGGSSGLTDVSGNQLAGTGNSFFFTTRGDGVLAPAITSIFSPLVDETGVGISKVVSIGFSKQIDPLTITSDSFILWGNDTQIDGNYTSSDVDGSTTAYFTPASPLDYNQEYIIIIKRGILGTDGARLNRDYGWSFTTVSAPSNDDGGIVYREKLEVASCYPKGDNGNTDTNVYVRFSMLINSDDINCIDGVDVGGREDEKFFVLKDSSGNRVLGRTKGHRRSIRFKPDSPMVVGEKYTATAKTTIRAANAAGTQMESDYSWTFTVVDSYEGEGD